MHDDVLDRLLNGDATRATAQPGDVAVVPQSPSMHDPDALEDLDVSPAQIQFIDKGEARVEHGLTECPHCMDGDAS